MKKQAFNPYLPSWEYIPDGEPHVFGERLYIYGSHDLYNGWVFCLGDYACWSAPIDDLSEWRYEGIIYEKTSDPINPDGKMCLYAPDITQGIDGKYYLFYVLDKVPYVSVAVSDAPNGHFSFYGYVHYKDGIRLGERAGDEPQFDPAVITEGNETFLYTGFCGVGDKSRHGVMVTVLESDMLTVKEDPRFIIPGSEYSAGSGFEKHEFFEAPSIRRIKNTYYFVYSSKVMHELCYATSDKTTEGFKYGGVIVSNCDLHIDTYKTAEMPTAYGANNHGGIVQIKDEFYIFYHRMTNNSWYSRQGCAEKLNLHTDGTIEQVEITSCGLNQSPLKGIGYYPSYIACNLFTPTPSIYVGGANQPKIMQDGRDGDKEDGYVANITDGTTVGFKYFDFHNLQKISIETRGYAKGVFEVKTSWDGAVFAEIPIEFTNVWETYTTTISIPDGKAALYFTYRGEGTSSFKGFTLC